MIQLYSGVPGAGKTYKMVADLDAFLKKEPDINLVSNIRELKLPHLNFDDMLMEYFPDKALTIPERIERFFQYEFQQQLNGEFGGPVMYVLDECQLYFPRRTSLPNTEAYLQRHRHLGHYLYLATQSSKLINSNIVALIEIEYYAVRRSISLFGEMHYRKKSPQSNQIIDTKVIRPNKKIFKLYKSFEADEITKPKRSVLKKMWPLILVLIGGVVFYNRFFNVEKRVARFTGRPVQQSAPASSAAPAGTAMVPAGQNDSQQKEIETLRSRLEEKERVFLPVVLVSGKKMTIDPETNAYVEVKKIKHRVTCGGDEGLNCYFDRPVEEAIRVAGSNSYGSPYPPASSLGYGNGFSPAAKVQSGGTGSFVEPGLVPGPDALTPSKSF